MAAIRKSHLLLEGKTTILVGVEEADETVGLALRGGEVALISEEVEDLEGADKGVRVSVKSLEGGVRGEVADGAEALAGGLEASLSVTNSDEQLLESALRFESKGHVSKQKQSGQKGFIDKKTQVWKVRTNGVTYEFIWVVKLILKYLRTFQGL